MQNGIRPAASLPVFDNDQMAAYLREGFWRDNDERPRSFNLSDTGDGAKGGALQYYAAGLEPEAEAMVASALALYSEVLGVSFERLAMQSVRIDLRFTDTSRGAFTKTYMHDGGAVGLATINVEADWLNRNGDAVGDYSYLTYIHEIGHALGLGHAGNYDGYAVYVSDTQDPEYGLNSNVSLNESWQMTMMSYLDQDMNPTVAAERAIPLTPMIADWIALEEIYGPSDAYSGNTVWGFGTTITQGPYAAIAERAGRNAFTILDRGGNDLLDLTGVAEDQRIDLRPERYSDVAGLRGNMGIARDTVIESFRSGSGDDRITGNDAANRIWGGDGDDRISGGQGADRLWGGDGRDELFGGAGEDRLSGGAGVDRLAGGEDRDVLSGGAGADVFRFTAETRVRTDRIVGESGLPAFESAGPRWGDRIDLSAIDADQGTPGDQAFVLGGRGPGRVWLEERGDVTIVQAQVANHDNLRVRIAIEDGEVAAADYARHDFLL
jgi:serralysin